MPVSIDDSFFDMVTHKYGIGGGASYCYEVLNGRWFSHLVSCFVFSSAGHHALVYSFFIFGFTLFFIFCVSFFYKNYCKTFCGREVSFFRSLGPALVATALLYFLLYPGRREVWFWLSSTANHLLSVSLCVLLIGLLIAKKNSILHLVLIFIVAACVGGLNEVNAICTALLMAGLFFFLKKVDNPVSFKKIALAGSAILLSLLVNFLSDGYKARMDGLPDFTFLQSFKNTLHSFLLPLLQKDVVPVMIIALLGAVFVLQRQMMKEKKSNQGAKKLMVGWLVAFGLVAFSFFLHCYTLSDIVPARGALWGYSLLLFMAFLSLQPPQKQL